MILVILGTQDKPFTRLLEAVDKCIIDGTIKDKVIVQAGQTEYKSDNMEIFDLLPAPEFERLVDKASLIITHGGVGSILMGIKKGKKIIAVPRLSKYGEHHNDHQKQIISEFAKEGYVLELKDSNALGKVIEKSRSFKQKKFESNTNNMIKLLENYIEDKDNISWYNKYSYIFVCSILFFVNIVLFLIINLFGLNLYITNLIAGIITLLFLLNYRKKTTSLLIGFIYLIIDMIFMLLFIDKIHIGVVFSKVTVDLFILVINCLLYKFLLKK